MSTLVNMIVAALEEALAAPKLPDLDRAEALATVQDPATDEKRLRETLRACPESMEIARAVARHPNLGAPALARMHAWLPEDAAANPSLAEYSKDETWAKNAANYRDKGMRGYADGYSSSVCDTHPELYRVQHYLEKGSASDFRHVAAIGAIPNDIFRPHLTSKNSHLRKALAGRTHFERSDLAVFCGDNAKSVRLALAGNPALAPELIERLTNDEDADVRAAALAHPNCPEATVHTAEMAKAAELTKDDKPIGELTETEIIESIRDPATSAARLDAIAASASTHIRYGCGLHPNASVPLLESLAAEETHWLAEAVAFNTATPTALLEKIAANANAAVRQALAWNAATPESVQLALAESGPRALRYILANSTSSISVWARLIELATQEQPATAKKGKKPEPRWEDHLATAFDPSTSGTKLRGLQRSTSSRHTFVARLAARHPNCPESLYAQYGYYCYGDLAQNPKFALALLESPAAVPSEPIKDWLLNDWARYDGTPGHVVNFYLQSNDKQNKRRSVRDAKASVPLLQRLVHDPDVLLRNSLASRKDLTRYMFEMLARDNNKKTRELIAKNPRCPADVLQLLGEDKVATVRAAAVQHPSYPASSGKPRAGSKGGNSKRDRASSREVMRDRGPRRDRIKMAKEARSASLLEDLSQDKVTDVRETVARNIKTPQKVLRALASDSQAAVRVGVARNDKARMAVVELLFDDADEDVRCTAMRAASWLVDKNDQAEALFRRIAGDPAGRIRAIAASAATDNDLQESLSQDDDPQVLSALSGNRSLRTPIARRLFDSDDYGVRRNVIRRTNDIALLERGVRDESTGVREAAASNKLTQQHALRLAMLHCTEVNSYLAYSPKLSNELFDILLDGGDAQVLRHVASEAKLNRSRVERLLATEQPGVLEYLLHRELLKPGDIEQLMNGDNRRVRCLIAENSKLTQEQFDKLLNERSEEVCQALAHNILSEEQEAQLAQVRREIRDAQRAAAG